MSASLFQVWYVACDTSPGFVGAICMRLLEFSVTYNCIKLFELLDTLNTLLIWFSKNSWSLLVATKIIRVGLPTTAVYLPSVLLY